MGRETFTSLKATHYAHRLAGEILYSPPLELNLTCPACGERFQLVFDEEKHSFCKHCGVGMLRLPLLLASEQRRQEVIVRDSELIHIDCEQRALQRTAAQAQQDKQRMILVPICLAAAILAVVAAVF